MMTKRLALLNGLAILGVVISHAAGWGQIAIYSGNWVALIRANVDPSYAPIDTLSWYILVFIRQAAVFSVAAFLFASGWFITYAVGRQSSMSWKVVRTRLIALLLPYILWSVVIYVSDYVLKVRHSPLEYLVLLFTTGADGSYYFVPLLCYFYLISPFLIPLARKHGTSLLIVAGAIQLFTVILRYLALGSKSPIVHFLVTIIPSWSFPCWIFYYVLGLVSGFQIEAAQRWIARLKWPAVVLLAPLAASATFEYVVVYHTKGILWGDVPIYASTSLYALVAIVSFLAFDVEALLISKPLRQLGMRSYGIYLLHIKLMEAFGRLCYHFAPVILAIPLVYVPIQIVVGLGGVLLFMSIVAKSPIQKSYRYLFG